MSNSLRTIILQTVREKFPKIQWKLGSLVRELVIEPLSYMADIFDNYVSIAEANLDITNSLDNPEANKIVIDNWITKLGLTLPEPRNATGTVKILVSSPEELTIENGVSFTYEDYQLSVQGTHTFGTLTRPFTTLGIDCYEAEVPVMTGSSSALSLSSGVSVNWEGAPSNVLDMYIGDPICGGINEITYQEKANMIRTAINNNPVIGKEYLAAAVCRNFNMDIVDAVAGDKDINRPFDVLLYLKPARQTSTITKSSVTYEEETKTYAKIPALGITEIKYVLDTYGTKQEVVAITKETINSEEFFKIELSKIKANESITVYCSGFSIYIDVQKWLNEAQQHVPYKYTAVLPVIATIKMDFKVDKELTFEAREALCSYINNKPLNSVLKETEIKLILENLGYKVLGCVLFSASINSDGYKNILSQASILDCSGGYGGNGKPVALFLTSDNIKASY